MKRNIILAMVFISGVSVCYAEVNKDLSHFIYSLPIMKGMEIQGKTEEVKYRISDNIEIAVITKVLQSKEGQNISAQKISKFYNDHFVSLDFRARQDASGLSGTYGAPRLVTNGNASIRSEGRIGCWIPKDGNSVTFFIYQRRTFDIRKSKPLLDKIKAAFEIAADAFKYKFTELPDYTLVSDWPEYLENEYFVDRVLIQVGYEEVSPESRRDIGDNKSYMFYCSVFPTFEHAQQWRNRIIEEHNRIQRWPDWFVEGVGMSPIVVKNIVVEYKGQGFDKDNPDFGKRLIDELKKIDNKNTVEGN